MVKVTINKMEEKAERKRSFSINTKNLSLSITTPEGNRSLEKQFKDLKFLPGDCITFLSAKEWSTWELVQFLLNLIGPADMWFTTYTISELSARKICTWLDDGSLLSVCGVTDTRAREYHPGAYHLCKSEFAEIKSYSCHAKVTVLKNENYNISINASCNWTENPRIESGTIICDEEVANKHISWIKNIIECDGENI